MFASTLSRFGSLLAGEDQEAANSLVRALTLEDCLYPRVLYEAGREGAAELARCALPGHLPSASFLSAVDDLLGTGNREAQRLGLARASELPGLYDMFEVE